MKYVNLVWDNFFEAVAHFSKETTVSNIWYIGIKIHKKMNKSFDCICQAVCFFAYNTKVIIPVLIHKIRKKIIHRKGDFMKKKQKIVYILITNVIVLTFIFCAVKLNNIDFGNGILSVNATGGLSNKKICWGIKREGNHKQPDVGKENKRLLDEYKGICIGNDQSKKIYLTFDAGYEAGYMEKILEVLKQNDVKACFFITAHYLNTQPELVKRMIDDGHIVGNHTPNYLMFGVYEI